MNYLIDTNVVSEWKKPEPNPQVVRWLAEADEDHTFMSSATIAELRFGAERLPMGKRREQLLDWLKDDISNRFAGRILLINDVIAHAWGVISAQRLALGRPIGIMDAFLAATAEVHGMTLVTRNVSDFINTGVTLLNPWDE